AYGAPIVFLAFGLPWVIHPLLFRQPTLVNDIDTSGFAYLITTLVLTTFFSPMLACAHVTRGFRMERERSTLGFLLMTPLSSVKVVVGHMIGPAIPALAYWTSAAGLGLVSMLVLASEGHVLAALWGWGLGFGVSLLFLALSLVTG